MSYTWVVPITFLFFSFRLPTPKAFLPINPFMSNGQLPRIITNYRLQGPHLLINLTLNQFIHGPGQESREKALRSQDLPSPWTAWLVLGYSS